MNKIARYEKLVEKISRCPNIEECSKKEPMLLCECCNEVNLWTYWEGGRDRLDARILVVGQDWGKIDEDYKNISSLYGIADARYGTGYTNMICDPGGITDENLCELFESIGFPDVRDDFNSGGRKCNDIFFTNFICCYRKEKTSGSFHYEWIEKCKGYFIELVEIIEPEIIICLGKSTYNAVRIASGQKSKNGSYNNIILGGCEEMQFGDIKTFVFPMAHPGTMGTLNRCRAADNISDNGSCTISIQRGIELQKKDWRAVQNLLKCSDINSNTDSINLKPVIHRNMYGPSCEVSGLNNPKDFEIYCRKEHKVCIPDCNGCLFMAGNEMGKGIACEWNDTHDIDGIDGYIIQHSERYKEFTRIEKMINPDDIKMNVEVYIAMLEEQAKKQRCPECIYPALPKSKEVYFNLEKIPDELCIEKKIGWESRICAYKKDFEKIINILYPDGCGFDFQSELDIIDGDKFCLIGFSD